jgi:protein SCO1/2
MTTESKTENTETGAGDDPGPDTDAGTRAGSGGDARTPAPRPVSGGPSEDRVRLVALLVAIGGVILLAITAVALMSQGDDEVATIPGNGDAAEWHGTLIDPAKPRPEFTLTDTEGRPYDFSAETSGKLTLLFFGYTYCPDICPVQMAVVGSALEKPGVPDATVVFVTTDPARDTPERLRDWLDQMPGGEAFVGLSGSLDEITAAETAAGVAASIIPAEDTGPGQDYEVGHAAQILAFTPDDRNHLAYPAGVRSEDWLADLPRMVERWGAGSGDTATGGDGSETDSATDDDDGTSDGGSNGDAPAPATAGDLTLSDAFASTSDSSSAVYVTIDNAGDDDTLVGARSPAAGAVTIMQTEPGGSMSEGTDIDIPSGTTELANGGVHVMLEGLSAPLEAGDTIELQLELEKAGTVSVDVEILDWSDMVERIEGSS